MPATPRFRDLDGDGRATGWGDAWGWGKFPGHGGMALLSRLPLGPARTFRLHPWGEGRRLSSRSHWDVPATLPDGRRLHLLASNPTPPLFAEENPRRNADEIAFWSAYLSGTPVIDDAGETAPLPDEPAVVLGNLNADPFDGAGLHEAIAALLAHPRLQDPRPASPGAAAAPTPGHEGPPALDTADWTEPAPGNLRTDYVLPSPRPRGHRQRRRLARSRRPPRRTRGRRLRAPPRLGRPRASLSSIFLP